MFQKISISIKCCCFEISIRQRILKKVFRINILEWFLKDPLTQRLRLLQIQLYLHRNKLHFKLKYYYIILCINQREIHLDKIKYLKILIL